MKERGVCDNIDPAQWWCPECGTLHEFRHRAPSQCRKYKEVPVWVTTIPNELAILEPWLFDPRHPPMPT